MARPKRQFVVFVGDDGIAENYEGVEAVAERHGLSVAWVRRLCQQGRIVGAFRVAGHRATWLIPTDWQPVGKGDSKEE